MIRDPQPRPVKPPVWAGYLLALAMTAAATLATVVFNGRTDVPNLSLIFVLPVVIAAVAFGWGPALVAALGGVLAFNYFLIEPLYTLDVADPDNVWALVLLLTVGALVSGVAGEARRRALTARRAESQARALQRFAGALAGATDRDAIAASAAEALSRLLDAPACIYLEEDAALRLAASAGGAEPSPVEAAAAEWSLAARLPTRAGAYPCERSRYDFWPVRGVERGAAIGLRLAERSDDVEALVETVAGYLAVALQREALARQATAAEVREKQEQLKTELLAAVSHDLKTPLSTILFSLQSLQRFEATHTQAERRELVGLAEGETRRLSGMVANLLDMGRLDVGAVPVRPQTITLGALVKSTLQRVEGALAHHRLVHETGGERQAVRADPQLTEAVLGNLIENAAKYSPKGAVVRIRSGGDKGAGWIEIEDEGPGFGPAAEAMFERFARGVAGDGRAPGTGLGLSIARRFAEAQGGRVEVRDRTDRTGAVLRLTLPAVRQEATA